MGSVYIGQTFLIFDSAEEISSSVTHGLDEW